ncbi:MAG: D-alanine--D-alanine ligase, partial [Deinococcus sp.]|nr:D-alanine--D-alanine ligase [Deinococcus sp.]
ELRAQVQHIIAAYRQPALVEEFIAGREVTVGVIGNEDPHVLPPLEVDLSPVPSERGVYTNYIKLEVPLAPRYLCPAPLSTLQWLFLRKVCLKAYRVLGCLDVCRFDFRLGKGGFYLLEANPLPGLTPGYSDLVTEAQADGMDHPTLINTILNLALARYGMPTVPERAAKAAPQRLQASA